MEVIVSRVTTPAPRIPFREVLLIFGLASLLFLSGNSILPLIDRDEPRFAEAAREMLQRDDLIIPWFNGDYRFDKPPLIYWCQIACYKVFGETEFASRLPSALFGAGTAVLIFLLGRRLASARVGWMAALMFATCLQTVVHARLAVADMAMIFFVTLSGWTGWELATHRKAPGTPCRPRWSVFWLSMGLGFLAKGPIAWLPLVGVIWLARRQEGTSAWRQLRPLSGSLLMLLVVALWGVPALILTDGAFYQIGIGKHVVHRTVSVMEGHGAGDLLGYLATLPMFFVTVFPSFFPWSIWLPGALLRQWRQKQWTETDRYLWIQLAMFFIVFTVSRTKLPHYTLPAFPFMALWMAHSLEASGHLSRATFRRTLTGMVAFVLVLCWIGFPLLAPHFASRHLYQATLPHLQPTMDYATADYEEPSMVWEFRGTLDSYLDRVPPDEARGWIEGRDFAVLVGRRATLEELVANPPPGVQVIEARGLNMAKFKPVELVALIKSGTPSKSQD